LRTFAAPPISPRPRIRMSIARSNALHRATGHRPGVHNITRPPNPPG
jgi:hypothetical protein